MARKIKVDMTGVESFSKCEEGQHVVKVIEAKESISQAGNDTITLKLQVMKGNSKDAMVWDTLTITEKALWRVKQFLEAIGQKSAGKVVIDLDKIEGKTCIANVIHEEYNGSLKAKVDEYKKLQASKSKYEDEDDEEDEEEPDNDDFEEDEDDDEEDEPAPKKGKKSDKKSAKKEEKKSTKKEDKKSKSKKDDKKSSKKKDEPEDDDFDDDDDEEWDED